MKFKRESTMADYCKNNSNFPRIFYEFEKINKIAKIGRVSNDAEDWIDIKLKIGEDEIKTKDLVFEEL
jgi:hypothetical protein